MTVMVILTVYIKLCRFRVSLTGCKGIENYCVTLVHSASLSSVAVLLKFTGEEGEVTWFLGCLKISLCEDRRLKDTQNLKCEDERLQYCLMDSIS